VFLAHVPNSVRVGVLEFTVRATLLQSPTTDHALDSRALVGLHAFGHTAIGTSLLTAIQVLRSIHGANGKRVPAAIILLSDGGSFLGVNPLAVARQAAAEHIPIYTIALGTAHGAIPVGHRMVPVPVESSELQQIASLSRGRSFTAGDAATVNAIYRGLAMRLGHKHVEHEVSASFAGAGLILLLIGGALSLYWFRRLA
jgi:Ca-activated chloride channel family protein